MSIPVIHVSSKEELSSKPNIGEKCLAISAKFQKKYGSKPDFISRSPGRVNLIGEHIDYCDFSVLPMAINVDFLCAVKVMEGSKVVTLINDDARFGERKIELPSDGSYVKSIQQFLKLV